MMGFIHPSRGSPRGARRTNPWRRWLVLLVSLTIASCDGGTTEAELSLVGTWDVIGFTDEGAAAETTGTWIFLNDGTFSVAGTAKFPGEPTENINFEGTYLQSGNTVELTIDQDIGTWTLDFTDDQVVLTETEEQGIPNTITLRRRQ